MTDVGLVLFKLQRLAEQIELVRQRRPDDPEILESDLVLRDALALALLVAIQEVIDIAYHICADEGWGVPDSHAGAMDLLAAHGVFDAALATRLSAVARVRNRIAHGYATVDQRRLWSELPAGLTDLEACSRAVADWLGPRTDPEPGGNRA